MTATLHGKVKDACEGEWGWVRIPSTNRWFMARVREDHLEVFDGADMDIDACADLPWWPISEPPYEPGETYEPTFLVKVMSGELGSVTTGARILDVGQLKEINIAIHKVLDDFLRRPK